MSNDSYLRSPLKLPDSGPAFPVAWLILPWAALAIWAIELGPLVMVAQVTDSAFIGALARGALVRFQIVAGIALFLTWALLYIAWPSHTRVFCWIASIAYLPGWAIGAQLGSHAMSGYPSAVRPAIVAGCVLAAIVVQAYAARVHKEGSGRL